MSTALFLSAKAATAFVHLSHHNSVRPTVTQADQSNITKSSLVAAWKPLVSGTVKLFHKFKGGHPKQGC